MPITEKQRQLRRKYIGASDVGAIIGVDPFKSAADVWASKVYDTHQDKVSSIAEMGIRNEGVILDWCAEKLGVKIRKNVRRVNGIFAASLDAVVIDKPWCLEAKLTTKPEDWGKVGTDEVPVRVIAQVQTQMHCSGYERTYVPVQFVGDSPRYALYVVDRNETLIERIVEICSRFWTEHVIPKVMPSGPPPSIRMSRVVKREPESVVELDESGREVVRSWLRSREKKLDAAREEAGWKGAALALLGDKEVGVHSDGYLLYTPDANGRRTLRWKEDRDERQRGADQSLEQTR